MKKIKKERSVPKWVLRNLRLYGNCCCGYDLIKKYGEKKKRFEAKDWLFMN